MFSYEKHIGSRTPAETRAETRAESRAETRAQQRLEKSAGRNAKTAGRETETQRELDVTRTRLEREGEKNTSNDSLKLELVRRAIPRTVYHMFYRIHCGRRD